MAAGVRVDWEAARAIRAAMLDILPAGVRVSPIEKGEERFDLQIRGDGITASLCIEVSNAIKIAVIAYHKGWGDRGPIMDGRQFTIEKRVKWSK
jgi:hypothetical protein